MARTFPHTKSLLAQLLFLGYARLQRSSEPSPNFQSAIGCFASFCLALVKFDVENNFQTSPGPHSHRVKRVACCCIFQIRKEEQASCIHVSLFVDRWKDQANEEPQILITHFWKINASNCCSGAC